MRRINEDRLLALLNERCCKGLEKIQARNWKELCAENARVRFVEIEEELRRYTGKFAL